MRKVFSTVLVALFTLGILLTGTAQAAKYPTSTKHIYFNGNLITSPAGIVAPDSGHNTTFMPIWYVGYAVNKVGFGATWNGVNKTWKLTLPTGVKPAVDLSTINPGHGGTEIYVNGTLVQSVNTIASADPSTGHTTTYMPIFYVEKVLKYMGITSGWDGTTWTMTSQTQGQSAVCRTAPLAGVYHPSRLIVKDPCKTVSGTVESIRHEADKDYHINLKLDTKYANLINDKNVTLENGDLVVEVIPMDADKVHIPSVGEHITVTGAYVDDTHHGWMEIHPAWLIKGQGSTAYTAAEAAASVQTGVCGNGDPDCTDTSTGSTSTPTSTGVKDISVVSSTLNVTPGEYASITIKTIPGATGSIEVDYASGPSQSKSLVDKTADSNGLITWRWEVGTHTTSGEWPVKVTVNGETWTTNLVVN